MTTLFLGPYRHKNLIGYLSKIYLDNIKLTTSKLCSRFIPVLENIPLNTEVFSSENNNVTTYERIIQHLPINHLALSKNNQYNIAIPIFNNKKLDEYEKEKLTYFDEIWVDNAYAFDVVSKIKNAKVKFIRPAFKKDQSEYFTNNKENLSFWNFFKKMYFVGDYEENLDIINHLIIDFAKWKTQQYPWCLVFYLPNIKPQQKEELSQYAMKIFNACKYSAKNIPIIIVDDECNYHNICKIHNSCDLLLNVNEVFNPINYWYAKSLSNKIVEFTDCSTTHNFFRNNYLSLDQFECCVNPITESKHNRNNQFSKSLPLSELK